MDTGMKNININNPNINDPKRKQKRRAAFVAVAAACLLAGCAPQEKTLILERGTRDSTGEDEQQAEDFTVKKIYTYDYETNPLLEQSAFLDGCGEYKVRVIAQETQEDGGMPVGRTVDYRYGFYDLLGESETPWEAHRGEESEFWGMWMQEEIAWEADAENAMASVVGYLYPANLQPSPDGRELLVYAVGEDYNGGVCGRVWLYDLETQRPRLLYRGREALGYYNMAGAFSENGRWMTFDVTGTGSGSMIAVYDCRKEWPADDADVEWMEVKTASLMYPPDKTLHAITEKNAKYWTAELFDYEDNPGYLCFWGTDADNPQVFAYYMMDNGVNFMSSYYLYGNLSDTMPHFRYELDKEAMRVYYLEDFSYLRYIDAVQGTTAEAVDLQQTVLDFIRLDSGEMLALTTPQEPEYLKKRSYQIDSLLGVQLRWDITTVDLYLFSEDGGVDTLLYKNLRNVAAMEYDADNRRILLELIEDESMTRRRCMILEL
ncbi:MAG: hypothetical protein NC399_10085 [Muribaculum sp.]|nr:hypothetical protein [Muribaculum sp.]